MKSSVPGIHLITCLMSLLQNQKLPTRQQHIFVRVALWNWNINLARLSCGIMKLKGRCGGRGSPRDTKTGSMEWDRGEATSYRLITV